MKQTTLCTCIYMKAYLSRCDRDNATITSLACVDKAIHNNGK